MQSLPRTRYRQKKTPEEQKKLAADFDRVEIEKMGAGTHARLHASMDRLLAELTLQ